MTDADIKKLIFVTKAAYPRAFEKYTKDDLENLLIAWRMCLEGYSYEIASRGLKAYMMTDTKGFPPSVGQIIDCIHKLTPEKEPMGAIEAWNMVMKAIRNGSYNAQEEYEKLDPLIQKTIGGVQYIYDEATNNDFNMDVAKGQFIKNYEIMAKREKEMAKLPDTVRIGVQERMGINGSVDA